MKLFRKSFVISKGYKETDIEIKPIHYLLLFAMVSFKLQFNQDYYAKVINL